MPTEDNKAVVRREFEEMLNQGGNLDAAAEIYAPNYVAHAATYGDIEGIEGAKQSAAAYRQTFPDLRTTIEDMVAEGDKVVVRYRGSGTHEGATEAFGPPTGKRMEITGITILRLSEGKIVEVWTNFDALGMMQQLGMIPEPGQAGS